MPSGIKSLGANFMRTQGGLRGSFTYGNGINFAEFAVGV